MTARDHLGTFGDFLRYHDDLLGTSGDLLASGGAFRVLSEEDGATGAWQDQHSGTLQQHKEASAYKVVTGQARSCPRGQTGPQRGTEGSTLCAWGAVICPEGCGTNPMPPQCSQASFGVGHPTGWARKPKGNKAATGPSRLSPGQRDNEMGSPHPKYCS